MDKDNCIYNIQADKALGKGKKVQEVPCSFTYKLSDPLFINNGWTTLPHEEIMYEVKNLQIYCVQILNTIFFLILEENCVRCKTDPVQSSCFWIRLSIPEWPGIYRTFC